MGFKYAVIGSGRQGVASAYDFVKFGDAEKVLLIDYNFEAAQSAAKRVNELTSTNLCEPFNVDVKNSGELKSVLAGVDSIVSAVPYYFNLELSKLAIEVGANFCDMGGNTEVVLRQLELNEAAENTGITIVPDTGMDPGMNISFIMHLISLFDEPQIVKSYGAGLVQNPSPPWNYKLSFNINGLTNEYFGSAHFLRDGKVTEVPCFEGSEVLEFPAPLGKLEAAVTSGGLSTLPWTLEGKLQTLENKTLRYPGHWTQFKAFSQLGLFELDPIEVNGNKIVPRDFYHALLEPKIYSESFKDIGILKVIAKGKKDGKDATAEIELIDKFDEATGFTAMQRLTGWHSSTIAILAAKGNIEKGALPVEKAVPGNVIIDEIQRRGLDVKQSFSFE
jgi:lysine 6-dehydrogenase